MTSDRMGMLLHTLLMFAVLASVTFLAYRKVITSDAAMVVIVGVAGISGVTISRAGATTYPELPPGTTLMASSRPQPTGVTNGDHQ